MIERKITIGLITSTEFCNSIKNIWDLNLFESPTAKLILSWTWEYYLKFKKAPSKEIETIFYSKLKTIKIGKEIADEIEKDILPGLSDEFTKEEFNLDYLIEETEKYFSERHLQIFHENVEALTKAGKLEEAEKLVREYKPLSKTGKLSKYMTCLDKLEKQNTPSPTTLLSPWLKEGQITIIYANYGVGKSLLSILVGYLCGLREYDKDEASIGEWFVKTPTGCLYIDGELGEKEMGNRIKQYKWVGEQPKSKWMQIFSIPDYQIKTEDMFYLGNRKNQLEIVTWLMEHPNYKLIILDSVSTLFGLLNENDNSEWGNKVNPFLRDLRALNVACILLHHSGKNAKTGLRGASAMGAMAENIFKLQNHPSINADAGEAWFTLIKEKQRSGGKQFKNFSIHFFQNEEKTETSWEITRNTEV
jgi:hypothetical protein